MVKSESCTHPFLHLVEQSISPKVVRRGWWISRRKSGCSFQKQGGETTGAPDRTPFSKMGFSAEEVLAVLVVPGACLEPHSCTPDPKETL